MVHWSAVSMMIHRSFDLRLLVPSASRRITYRHLKRHVASNECFLRWAFGILTASVSRTKTLYGFVENLCAVRDTDRWRQELSMLALASGLGVDKEEQRQMHRPVTNAEQQNASRSGARYSARTGRFNEGTPKSRGRTGSKHGTGNADVMFQMPENEREMWVSDRILLHTEGLKVLLRRYLDESAIWE